MSEAAQKQVVDRALPDFDEDGNAIDPVKKKQEEVQHKRLSELGTVTDRGDIEITFSSGATGTLYKCRLKHLKPTIDAVRTVFGYLGIESIDKVTEVETLTRMNDPNFLLGVVAMSLDDVVTILTSLTSFTRDELEDMDLEEVVVLITELWRLNSDFFTRKVMPQIAFALQGNPARA